MKYKYIYLIVCLLLCLTGCSKDNEKDVTGEKVITGFIYIEGEQLQVDEVEIINREDKEKLEAVGLTEDDCPSGYCIYNKDASVDKYSIDETTVYSFTDIELKYVKDEEGDRIYETKVQDEFINGSSYNHKSLSEQRIPYIITIKGDKVIKIVEEFKYTM